MRCTGIEEGFAKEKKELPPCGQILYMKHLFYGSRFDCTFERIVGFLDISKSRSYGADPVEWITCWSNPLMDKTDVLLFAERYASRPLHFGFACFPIFDEQVRRVLVPEKFVSEDERILKKARLERWSLL